MSIEKFNLALNTLNAKQRKAVDTIEGPVLVIAGPGTGKTQLLSLRVGNIIYSSDTQPENILCLTFTDAAKLEMHERLSALIGPDASKVNVYTYHGLGNEIINSNPDYFGDIANFTQIDQLNQINIIKSILKTLSYKNEYKNERNARDLLSSISDLKTSLITPEDLTIIAEENLSFIENKNKELTEISEKIQRISNKNAHYFEELLDEYENLNPNSLAYYFNSELEEALEEFKQTNSTKPITNFKANYLEKDDQANFVVKSISTNKKLIDLAEIYKIYNDEVRKREVYDFDDIIIETIKVLEKNPDLKFTLQEKYHYILLDEYQDTNEAQARITQLLSDHPVNEGRPNVMAVGDDDQAIYAFQGALHSHMLQFVKTYKDVAVIVLDENYRSTSNIIEISKLVANKIDTRLSSEINIEKDFKSNKESNPLIIRKFFETSEEEKAYITSEIKKLKNSAVLSPKHKFLENISYHLVSEGVGVTYERKENVVEDELIKIIILNLEIINALSKNNHSKANELLPQLLNESYLGIDFRSILHIALKMKGDWINRMLENNDTSLLAKTLIKQSFDCLKVDMKLIIDQVIGLSDLQIDKINNKSKFYDYYLSEQDNLINLIHKLTLLINEFDRYIKPEKKESSLSNFIEFIDNIRSSEIRIPYSTYQHDSEVKMMTAFAAKGREFDNVFIPNLDENTWGEKSKSASNKVSLPQNLKYIRNDSNSQDDKLRLLYVALSRAKNQLILTSSNYNEDNKNNLPLTFLEESLEKDGLNSPLISTSTIPVTNIKVSNKQIIDDWQASFIKLKDNPDINKMLKERVLSFKLSASALNDFLDVRNAGPRYFLEHRILKYPSPDSLNLYYGLAIHEALDFLQKAINSKLSINNGDITDAFKNKLETFNLVELDYKNLSERGEEALDFYLNNTLYSFKEGDLSEVRLDGENIIYKNAKLTGNIDKLTIDKDELKIVDYKTGKSYSKWENEAKLHLYKNQLYFYKVLLNKSKSYSKYEINTGVLDFIESKENKSTLDLTYKQEDEIRLKKLIVAVWNHIETLNFPDISKYPTTVKGIKQFEDDLIAGDI